MKVVKLDGYVYCIKYKKELSNYDHTEHHVYHIISDNDNYPRSHSIIMSIMNDGSWKKGHWIAMNKQYPSKANALHPYHEFSYDEELDVYVYTIVIPHDD